HRIEIDGDIHASRECPCVEEQLVLVGLVQFVQLPESMALPTFVRLGCVDCVYHSLRNALYFAFSRGWVIRGGRADRGIHMPIRLRTASAIKHQLVGYLVERTSEVLDYVGGNGCQLIGNRIRLRNVIDALTGLRVFFVGDSIRLGISESLVGKLKVLDVLFG